MTNLTKPRKRFAQHWLQSEEALSQIVAAAELEISDRVLEIGPGTGILTRRLLSAAQAVVAVEIDRDLCKKLVKSFGKQDNFLLLQGDILELDLDNLLASFPNFIDPNKVVANIPYNITAPILEKLLGRISQPVKANYESIVLLIQKEVADRLVASPGSKTFGALSVGIQYLASCELICDVPAKAFYPPPKVDSAVVRLRPRPYSKIAQNPKHLETLVKLGFAQKRKMLKNNLKGIIEPSNLNELLEEFQINSQVRAEELSVENWVNLSDRFSGNRE
jgi:16S rRNA (adenine1518-N6/adenine1519-N6)-dimethyltransferase